MLRNPAYVGRAAYGKTESAERTRITRPLRQKGGFSKRCRANRERPREQWIEIAVPALISEPTFARAQERLAQNQRLSIKNTREITLLQGLLVCGECGYGLYRTSTRTSKRQAKYYRCLGSDRWRQLMETPCTCRPIRVEDVDEAVWTQVKQLLEDPVLIRAELERRRDEGLRANPDRAAATTRAARHPTREPTNRQAPGRLSRRPARIGRTAATDARLTQKTGCRAKGARKRALAGAGR